MDVLLTIHDTLLTARGPRFIVSFLCVVLAMVSNLLTQSDFCAVL